MSLVNSTGKNVPYKAQAKRQASPWTPEAEKHFQEAVLIYPECGKKKYNTGSKKQGRNELIAEYINRKMGPANACFDRKVVNSHIQATSVNLKLMIVEEMTQQAKTNKRFNVTEEKVAAVMKGVSSAVLVTSYIHLCYKKAQMATTLALPTFANSNTHSTPARLTSLLSQSIPAPGALDLWAGCKPPYASSNVDMTAAVNHMPDLKTSMCTSTMPESLSKRRQFAAIALLQIQDSSFHDQAPTCSPSEYSERSKSSSCTSSAASVSTITDSPRDERVAHNPTPLNLNLVPLNGWKTARPPMSLTSSASKVKHRQVQQSSSSTTSSTFNPRIQLPPLQSQHIHKYVSVSNPLSPTSTTSTLASTTSTEGILKQQPPSPLGEEEGEILRHISSVYATKIQDVHDREDQEPPAKRRRTSDLNVEVALEEFLASFSPEFYALPIENVIELDRLYTLTMLDEHPSNELDLESFIY